MTPGGIRCYKEILLFTFPNNYLITTPTHLLELITTNHKNRTKHYGQACQFQISTSFLDLFYAFLP